MRNSRALISVYKVRKVFGLIDKEAVQELHEQYLRVLEQDGKPEKGERKLADDLVILINELLDSTSTNVDSLVLYRIGFMEFALEKSPYNFDI